MSNQIPKKGTIMKFIIFLITASIFTACNSSDSFMGPKLGDEFEIDYGQSVTLEDHFLTIKFKTVENDSRCPEGVLCFWEGNARIVIEVSQFAFELNTSLEPMEIDYFGFKIELISVNPYPVVYEHIDLEDYRITLIVSE
jgi:hypothetical protein